MIILFICSLLDFPCFNCISWWSDSSYELFLSGLEKMSKERGFRYDRKMSNIISCIKYRWIGQEFWKPQTKHKGKGLDFDKMFWVRNLSPLNIVHIVGSGNQHHLKDTHVSPMFYPALFPCCHFSILLLHNHFSIPLLHSWYILLPCLLLPSIQILW